MRGLGTAPKRLRQQLASGASESDELCRRQPASAWSAFFSWKMPVMMRKFSFLQNFLVHSFFLQELNPASLLRKKCNQNYPSFSAKTSEFSKRKKSPYILLQKDVHSL